MASPLRLASSLLASTVTAPRGLFTKAREHQPEHMISLYDIENCPHCRVVREALTQLDLNVIVYPCPRGGERFRPFVMNTGGKSQFPFLIDPNTDKRLYESTRIVRYLYKTYSHRGAGMLGIPLLSKPPAIAASALRSANGIHVRASRVPEKPLQLWSFEASPFARLVRERLCELELPYHLHNVGKTALGELLPVAARERFMPDYVPDSPNRSALMQRAGQVQVPYLYDPNTKKGMFESKDICKYLDKTYAR